MAERESELEKLEKLAESFGSMGDFTQMIRESYSRLESKFEDLNSRLARVNELLRASLTERNRLANYLNCILESLDSAVVVTDQSGSINIFNAAAEKLTGRKADAVIGRDYFEALGDSAAASGRDILSQKRDSLSGERLVTTVDGLSTPVAYSITRLRPHNADGLGGMVEIMHNLSEIKKLQEDLKRISTLAALGEMAATVAHEIRNPIAGISGFASLLLRDLPPGDSNRVAVEKIKSGVASLDAIVENLLDFTRIITPDIREIELLDLIRDTVSEFRRTEQSQDCSISIECNSRSFAARLDPHLFRQILVNLIKNAIQAQPDGGKIRLKLSRGTANRVTLKVEDDGPGISEGLFDKLFTPFFTTKSNGTGLGLATVKKLVEVHGGAVSAANSPGGGAVFTVEFPRGANSDFPVKPGRIG